MYARDLTFLATPVGQIAIEGDDSCIFAIRIAIAGPSSKPGAMATKEAKTQLEQWFAGERQLFDVPLAPTTTPRGLALRNVIISIGYGETESYGALATRIGSGARAIGQACARNSFPIVIPCHRVLASAGLGNYSAGEGIQTKQWLLTYERRTIGRQA